MQQFTEIKEGNFICAKPSYSYVSFSFLGFLNVKGKSTVANLSLLDRRIWNRIEMVYDQYNLNSIEGSWYVTLQLDFGFKRNIVETF